METQNTKDVFWISLGDKICQLATDWRNIYIQIMYPSFGGTHVIAKHFYKLEMTQIRGTLDSIVCADYPREVHSIEGPGGRSITSVFYNGNNLTNFTPILGYKITTPRMKYIYEEDAAFIQQFLTRYSDTLNEITSSAYLNALQPGQSKFHFHEVKRMCVKLLRYIGEMRHMLQQAGFIL
jgi:hypothetical protein